ncbi:MAG: DUF4229 domain-containing protein [Candidatus Nanopelagicales bacterium]
MSNPDFSGSPSEPSIQPQAPQDEQHLPAPVPHAGGRYAALRLVILLAVGAVLYLVGLRGWLLAFAAVLVSGILSLFLLMKQRNDAAANLERNLEHWKHRRAHEDEDADEAQ